MGFVRKVKESGLKLIERLILFYYYLPILVFSVSYKIRIVEDSTKVLDYVFGRSKEVCGTGFIPRIKMLLSIAFCIRVYVIYTGFFIFKIIYVYL